MFQYKIDKRSSQAINLIHKTYFILSLFACESVFYIKSAIVFADKMCLYKIFDKVFI